jgi:hypothetical protein
MKQPTPREVEDGTFQLNSPKRHSHSTQIRLNHCVNQILDGQDLETTCEKVFGRVTEVLLDDIRTEIGRQCSKKDKTKFVCRHRNDLKNSRVQEEHPHQSTFGNPKNSDGIETSHKEKTFPDNRRVHYE